MEQEKEKRLQELETKQKSQGLQPQEKEELRLLNTERLAETLSQAEE